MKLVSVTVCNNREKVIDRMVESVAQEVDEVIILDTGITDDTLRLARARCEMFKTPFRVVSFPWINDFAAARNAALKAAADAGADWAFMLDSDEWYVSNGDSIRAAIEEAEKSGVRHLALNHRTGQYLQPRFFKMPASGTFTGETHEAYAPFMPALTMKSARFHDDDKTPEEIKAKCERDLIILETVTQEKPDDARWWYYLGDTYYNLGEKAKAMVAFEKCASIKGSWDEQRAWSCYRLAAIQCERSEWEAAVDSAALGLTYHAGISELAWLAAYAQHQAGKMAQCICWASMAASLGKHEGIGKTIGRVSFTYPMAQWEGPFQLMTSAYRAMGLNKEAEKQAIKFIIAQRSRLAADGQLPVPAAEEAPKPAPNAEVAFFEQMRSCRTNYRKLGDAIHAVLGAHEALDIGCGVGDATERLKEHGWDVCGAEYSPVARSMQTGVPMIPFDLTRTDNPTGVVDVVICTETAEHISAEHEQNVVDCIASRARKHIVFSAAQPGQEWEGHVNLKPIDFWVGKFNEKGWQLDQFTTNQLRGEMRRTGAQHVGAVDNFCVFKPAMAPTVTVDEVRAVAAAKPKRRAQKTVAP